MTKKPTDSALISLTYIDPSFNYITSVFQFSTKQLTNRRIQETEIMV